MRFLSVYKMFCMLYLLSSNILACYLLRFITISGVHVAFHSPLMCLCIAFELKRCLLRKFWNREKVKKVSVLGQKDFLIK